MTFKSCRYLNNLQNIFTTFATLLIIDYFTGRSFVDHFCYLCFVCVMLSCLFIAALWSSAGKGLTSWLSCVWCFVFCRFPMSRLIVSIPDLCHLAYFQWENGIFQKKRLGNKGKRPFISGEHVTC